MNEQSLAEVVSKLELRRAADADIPALARLLAICTDTRRISGAVRSSDAARLLVGVQYKQVDGWVVERDGLPVFASFLCRTLPGPAESNPALLAHLHVYALAPDYDGEYGIGLASDDYMLALIYAVVEASRVAVEFECELMKVSVAYRGSTRPPDLDANGAMMACGLMPDSYVFSGTVEEIVDTLGRVGFKC